MNAPQRKPWFRPKRLGYGVTPNSWQAWLLILLPGLLILAAGLTFALVVALRTTS